MSPFIYKAKYILLGVIFIAFVWVGAFGLLSIVQISQGEHSSGCTFSLGEHVICAMNPFEYLSVWQKIFTVPPTLALSVFLLIMALVFNIFVRIRSDMLGPSKSVSCHKLPRFLTFPIPKLYTELFSQGILHPKAP